MANIEKYANLMKKGKKSQGKAGVKNQMAKEMVKKKMGNGMHKMSGGHMMKDGEMKKMMK